MKGQGRFRSPLVQSISSAIPVDSACADRRPSGSLIFAHRAECAGASALLRPARSRLVCLLACVAASPPHEQKSADGGRRPSSPGIPGKTRICARRSPLGAFRHSAHGPAPAGQLARHRDVGHAALLARIVHGAAPVDEPASRPRWRCRLVAASTAHLPLGPGLSATSTASLVVPGGLDEQLSQVLVAGAWLSRARNRDDRRWTCSEGTRPTHAAKPDARGEPREAVGLARDRSRGDRVYTLEAFERVAGRLPSRLLGQRLDLRARARPWRRRPRARARSSGPASPWRRRPEVDAADPRPEITRSSGCASGRRRSSRRRRARA